MCVCARAQKCVPRVCVMCDGFVRKAGKRREAESVKRRRKILRKNDFNGRTAWHVPLPCVQSFLLDHGACFTGQLSETSFISVPNIDCSCLFDLFIEEVCMLAYRMIT